MSEEHRMSVALVTRNRPDSLERTLRSLRAQDVQPFEVIVSDDSDPERLADTRAVALAHGARHVAGPRRGLYANRNAVAQLCEGTHVRTMDDDHEFPAGHMSACQAAIERRPETVWIIGECVPGEEDTRRPWITPGQLHPRGHAVTPPAPVGVWAISDGASIYPRGVFDRGLRFCESFRFGASYLEWGSRLHWLGYDIRHLQETYIVHHLDLSARSFSDPRLDAGSRLFAGLCHSFIYQPSLRNQALTIMEFGATVRRHGLDGARGGADAMQAFRAQRPLSIAARNGGARL